MISLLAAVAIAAHPSACDWSHPGANPYRGDPIAAIADFDLPENVKLAIQIKMQDHKFDSVVTIGRDKIGGVGLEAEYTNLRDMHSGHGKVCHGLVDRSKWSQQMTERGLVYCAGNACVIVPTACNNVSLVDRVVETKPEDPIDIEPAAGPVPVPATPIAEVDGSPATFNSFELPDTGTGSGGYGYGFYDGGGGGGGFPGVPGGPASGPGCGCRPPHEPPPICTVPEPTTAMLFAAGIMAIFYRQRRRK